MNSLERDFEPPFNVSDYEDESYYQLLRQLPRELAKNHMRYIEGQAMNDQEIFDYLSEIIIGRREAVTVSEISDPHIAEIFAGREAELFKSLETTVFNDPANYLGAGTTAKVKLFNVTSNNPDSPAAIPMAVKYIVTPNSGTLTAQEEHNVVAEMDRIRTVEAAEVKHPRRSRFVRVPHPFLYHQNDKIQLYSMECVQGITLAEVLSEGRFTRELRESLRQSRLAEVTPDEMDGYIKRFFDTMHEHYIHGDIKPLNLMISRDGVLYVIDFGQSKSINNFSEKEQDALEVLKEDEIKSTQSMMRTLLHKVFKED